MGGTALFSVTALFQLVTLPCEFNASKRALVALRQSGNYTKEELAASKEVLTAAALTYVAALFVTVIQVLCSLALVAIVMLQSGKSAGLSGAIAGAADTFLSKNKAKSLDAKLAKATKWVAIAWVLVTLALCIVH